MFDKYIKKKSRENWKFWMFSYLVRPLFESYKKTMEGMTSELFADTVGKWVEENMSLIKLRPAILTALRKVSTKTGIIERPKDFQKDVLEIVTNMENDNQNDVGKKDAITIVTKDKNFSANEQEQNLECREVNTSSHHHHHHSHQTRYSLQKSPVQSDSVLKINADSTLLNSSLQSHSNYMFDNPALTNSSFQNHVMKTNLAIPLVKDNGIHLDVPMTSADLWDIPTTIPTVHSSSSLTDLVFTSAEENNLYESILGSLGSNDTSQEQMQVQTLPELSHDFMLHDTCSTTTTASAFPLMATGHDHTVEMLTVPSFSDLDMVPTSESSMDHVSFLLDLDSKDSPFLHSNSTNSFPGL